MWQGKIYWRKHPEGGYANFYEATGYGTTTGLGGYNCRHQHYAYFGDDDEQTYYHIDETVNKAAYEMEQRQRALERKLREWDRREKILNAGGVDSTEARRWKSYYKKQINDLVKSSNGFLKRDYSAEKAWSVPNASTTSTAGALPLGKKRLSDKVDTSKQQMYINPEKQSKHVPGGEKYEALLKKMGRKPSYFTCDTNELSKLFKKYAGTGQKEYGRKNGKMTWNNKEVIIANRKIIGYVVKEDSTEVPTSYFKIHYSKSGAHLVPLDPKKGERYEKIYRDGVAISWHRGH